MNYRQVEAAREVRLWIEHVIFPTVVVVGIALSNPKVREKVSGIFKRASGRDDVQTFTTEKENG